ncbi:MAG: LarC family nickel insertion protein [Thermodesulfobacteriota bacterium]
MARLLYVDACGGLSGDMLAGALLDLGWPLEELRGLIAAMGLSGEVAVDQAVVEHMGLSARRLVVRELAQEAHGHAHHHHHAHHHGHDHAHGHGHEQEHEHHHQGHDHHPAPAGHAHRGLAEVKAILAGLPPAVGGPAARVFERLAAAEGRVHGIPAERVHFHEVGALDAIVDITAFCAGLAWLGFPRIVCSPLPLGRGFVDCAHGRIPLPAPAVLELLKDAPVVAWPEEVETVTPTGAALVATLAEGFGGLPAMRLVGQGIGGGSRPSRGGPNIVRLVCGETAADAAQGETAADAAQADLVTEIVCHIDDMSPEDWPVVSQRLLDAGALDVACAPLLMKKGRPGLMAIALARPHQAEELAALMLAQTTSLGVRLRDCRRRILPRDQVTLDTPWGPARVKRARVGDAWRLHPEAEDVARICRETGLSPAEVRGRVEALAREAE